MLLHIWNVKSVLEVLIKLFLSYSTLDAPRLKFLKVLISLYEMTDDK